MIKTFILSLLLCFAGYLFAQFVPVAAAAAPTALLLLGALFLLGSICRPDTEQADDSYEAYELARQIDRVKTVKDALFFLLILSVIVGTVAPLGALFVAAMCTLMKRAETRAIQEQTRLQTRASSAPEAAAA